MGILDQFRNEDDAGEEDGGEVTDGGDGGGSDDPFGDDLGGFDDGGFDDFDDGFDDAGDDDASTGELRNRVDELENEVSSLSSTVNTVRSENEEISETVEDIEENVRKLLDIYEMVTRGVNPFVDDVSNEADFGTGSLGLFEDDDDGQQEEDLDSSVADADAEDFFDDDFDDDGGMDAAGAVSGDSGGDSAAGGDSSGGGPADDESAGDESGKSFSELKEEYEQGEAEWDGDAEEFDEAGDGLDGSDGGFETADDGFEAADDAFGDDGWTEGGDDDVGGDPADATSNGNPEAGFEEPPSTAADADPVSEPGPEQEPETAADATGDDASTEPERTETGDLQFAENTLSDSTSMGSKPYVANLPDGYVSDLIVMEWMEYLVDEADTDDAARAVRYYGAIEWIDESVEDRLLTFLRGFDEVEAVEGEPTPAGLTMAHHAQSLQYISRLASATSEMVVLNEWLSEGGDAGGLQR